MSTHNHEECADCIAREAAARREALLEAARDVALLGDPDMATWMRGLAEEQGA